MVRALQARGLTVPKLAVADGHAGIWAALATVWPETREQHCWNHKFLNVLGQLPRKVHAKAKTLPTSIPYAPTRGEAVRRRERSAKRYHGWYPKAMAILKDDWDRMVTFYELPEAQWQHLRTIKVVESPFAAVRLRTSAAKPFKRVESATALIWRILMVA